ncbi:glucosaminidase domain-containing protein [Parasalinivibrio latis]|uniref:glucosaminidase domain-containing protein n=1 Tax=Parasalinivibrio latis TaxID=2952610 RepID=UPI0030DFC540
MIKHIVALTFGIALIAGCGDYFGASRSDLAEMVDAPEPPTMEDRPDFSSFTDVKDKKTAFFNYLRPAVDYLNVVVEKARSELDEITKRSEGDKPLSQKDLAFLAHASELLSLPIPENGPTTAWFAEIRKRMDVVPPELVLSQAANESAWGTSRFAVEGNNYFGQWCYKKGCGLVPKNRDAGKYHEVAVFETGYDSVQAYFLNINRNPAYQSLREIRQTLREQNKPITGTALAQGLVGYSERGQAYVEEIRSMIRHNEKFWSQG